MKLIWLTTLMILIHCAKSSAQTFSIEELRSIRKTQIALTYCDSMLDMRNVQLENMKSQVAAYVDKSVRYESQITSLNGDIVYLREQLRTRDEMIDDLEKRNKIFKWVAIGSSGLVLSFLIINNATP